MTCVGFMVRLRALNRWWFLVRPKICRYLKLRRRIGNLWVRRRAICADVMRKIRKSTGTRILNDVWITKRRMSRLVNRLTRAFSLLLRSVLRRRRLIC